MSNSREVALHEGINWPQTLQLEVIRTSSFNDFDGDKIADSLIANKDLWIALMMVSGGGQYFWLLPLRDVPDDIWNVSAIYIRPAIGREDELEALASSEEWKANEIDWMDSDRVFELIGNSSRVYKDATQCKELLRVWWD